MDDFTKRGFSKYDYLGPDFVPAWSDLRNIGNLCTRCKAEFWDELDNPDFVEQTDRDGQAVKFKYFRDLSGSSESSYNSDLSSVHSDGYRERSFGSSTHRSGFYQLRWTKCNRKYVYPETLTHYHLNWKSDPEDSENLIIKAWISEGFQEELCRHTRRLKKSETTLVGSNPRTGSRASNASVDERRRARISRREEDRKEGTLVNLNQLSQRAPSTSPRTGSWVSTASENERLAANFRSGSTELATFNIERQLQMNKAYSPITLTKSGDSTYSEVSETDLPPLRDVPDGNTVDHPNDLPESEYDSGPDIVAETESPTATRFDGFREGKTSVFWNKYNGPTVEEVRYFAHRGCHLCTLILTTWLVGRSNRLLGRRMSKFLAPDLGDQRFKYRRISLELRHRYLYGQAVGCKSTSLRMKFGFSLLDSSDIHGESPSSVREEEVPGTAPAEVIANYWLRKCLADHGSTCGADLEPFLPSRVINVRGRGESDEPFIFQSNGKRAKYATLSYCWGQSVGLKSTKKTIEEYYQRLPRDTLPKTMRDAIHVTVSLGLEYLWIDSLCIIQDSEEDFQKEVGLMAQNYSQSTVTIAAIGATSADSGFPLTRNKLAMIDCRLSPNMVISAQVEGQEEELVSGTLHRRAWCFQEVQLAPRLLSCGGKELYFQCQAGTYREGSPSKLYFNDEGDSYRRRSDILTLTPPKAYSEWISSVEKYSRLKLTYGNDKLVAISALAARFSSLFESDVERPTSEDYLAGLWKGDLPRGLTWRAAKRSALHIPYRAPSWSWAASDEDIKYPSFRNVSWLAEVLEASTNVVSDLVPYGSVRSGRITLFGPVTTLPADAYKIDIREAKKFPAPAEDNPEKSSRIGSNEDDDDLSVYVIADEQTGLLPEEIGVEMVYWDNEQSKDINCVCLLLAPKWGIILSPVKSPGTIGVYQRVGYVQDESRGVFDHERDTELKRPGIGYYDGHPHWEKRVVTIV